MIDESRDSMGENNRTQEQKYICNTNFSKIVLQIGVASFYYKLGEMLLQTGTVSLLQIETSVTTN